MRAMPLVPLYRLKKKREKTKRPCLYTVYSTTKLG